MAKYIDVEPLIAAFSDVRMHGTKFVPEAIAHILETEPAVDAVPVVHSEWIPVDDDGDPGDTKCKRCGCYHHAWEAFGYYCQHCGAKMDGGKHEKND